MVSHTTTGEWMSFEARMRRRRADRLLLRADVATEAGCVDEAVECLAEIRRIDPSLPGLEAVEQKIQVALLPPAGSPPPDTHVRRKSLPIAAAVIVFAAVATSVGGPGFEDLREVANVVSAIGPAKAEATASVTGTTGLTADGPESIAPAARSTMAAGASNDLPSSLLAPPTSVPAPRPSPADPRATGSIPAGDATRAADALSPADAAGSPKDAKMMRGEADGEPRDVPRVAAAGAASALPGIEVGPPALPDGRVDGRNTSPAPLDVVPALTEPVVSVRAPVLAADAFAVDPPQDLLVRSVLTRYAAAYSNLDAEAAQRVWPRVNRAALTRAFDGLASQRVSLGECRIDVAGARARANCSGSATWIPRVGNGTPRTDARNWSFELAKAGAGWQIVDARVQNR
jgi:hypothetical protein